jgi:hypothetical protein
MKQINDKITARQFLVRIFVSNSGVSSRRVLAYVFSIALLFEIFFNYNIEYCKLTGLLIAGLLSLTTITSVFRKPDGEEENTVNNNKG